MLNTVNLFIALVVAAITYGTPLLFGTLGEVLTEKSGSLNLGVEGIMFMGGAIGLGGVFYYEKAVESPSAFLAVLIGLLCAFIAGGIASLIFSFLTITLRANQNVTGLALTIFGTGVGQYIGEIMRIREGGFVAVGNDLKAVFISSPFPQAMQDIPYVGKILFGNSIFFYLGVVLAIVMHLFLNKSRTGLQLRSVGESPATADAAGINVSRYRYLGAIIGGGTEMEIEALRNYGLDTGLAFQIQDDLLNLVGSEESTKKDFRSDITEGKRTLMVVHALANANQDDRSRLIEILSAKEKDSAVLSEAVEIMERAGSIDYARSYAENLTSIAKNRLVDMVKPSAARDMLVSMADWFVNRLK